MLRPGLNPFNQVSGIDIKFTHRRSLSPLLLPKPQETGPI